MKKFNVFGVIVFVLLYFAAVFASAFIGFAAPVCWVLFPALGAFWASFPYRWLSQRWRKFGLGTVLAAVLGLICLALGEMDVVHALIVIGFGLASDVLRLFTNKEGLAYPLLAIGNLAWILPLWTKPDWYHEGAIEEMGQAYADALMSYSSALWFCIALLAIIVMAILGYQLAKRWIK